MVSWKQLGLRILPHGDHPLRFAICAGLAFGVYMALADATLFSSVIPASQTAMVSSMSAVGRIALFAPLSILDELLYRLGAMSLLVWLLTIVAGKRDWRFWTAIIVTALVVYPLGHLAYLRTIDLLPLAVVREVALRGSAGILWGYIYWRHGLIAAIAAHISAHVSLEPLLGLLAAQ